METSENTTENYPEPKPNTSFYEHPHVQVDQIPVGNGVPIGIERVTNPAVGIGGAYGTWGESVDNDGLPNMLERMLGETLENGEKFNLAELGFLYRQFTPNLTPAENIELEVQVGKRFLLEATHACGWEPAKLRRFWSAAVVR